MKAPATEEEKATKLQAWRARHIDVCARCKGPAYWCQRCNDWNCFCTTYHKDEPYEP